MRQPPRALGRRKARDPVRRTSRPSTKSSTRKGAPARPIAAEVVSADQTRRSQARQQRKLSGQQLGAERTRASTLWRRARGRALHDRPRAGRSPARRGRAAHPAVARVVERLRFGHRSRAKPSGTSRTRATAESRDYKALFEQMTTELPVTRYKPVVADRHQNAAPTPTLISTPPTVPSSTKMWW